MLILHRCSKQQQGLTSITCWMWSEFLVCLKIKCTNVWMCFWWVKRFGPTVQILWQFNVLCLSISVVQWTAVSDFNAAQMFSKRNCLTSCKALVAGPQRAMKVVCQLDKTLLKLSQYSHFPLTETVWKWTVLFFKDCFSSPLPEPPPYRDGGVCVPSWS